MTSASPTERSPLVENGAPRVRLVLQSGNGEDRVIECRRVVTLIGARPGCKVHLRHRNVASVHAALVNDGHGVFAVDLVTDHGTLLNSLKLECEQVTDGDLLQIAQWTFRVDIDWPAGGNPDPAARDQHGVSLDPAPRFVALEHFASGSVLQPRRDICTLGRRNGCDIVIEDVRISRLHALLLRYYGHPAVFDLLSHNGTRVNGREVSYQMLNDGDILAVGEAQFRVRLIGAAVDRRTDRGAAPAARIPAALIGGDAVDIAEIDRAPTWSTSRQSDQTVGGPGQASGRELPPSA